MRVTSRVGIALRRRERRVNCEPIFADEVGNDRLAVPDRLVAVNDVGKLPARSGRGIEDVLVSEGHASEFEEGVDLQPVAVIVGDAEKAGVGIKGEHDGV